MRRVLDHIAPALAVALLATACGGGGGDSGGSPTFSGTGTIAINITDAPVDGATAVVLQFAGVALKRFGESEALFVLDPPLRVDMLALQGGLAVTLLPLTAVDAGPYESMRLLVDARRDTLESFVLLPGGAQRPLFIPDGAEAGLRVTRGFNVPAGGSASFTIDVDLRKSIGTPVSASAPYPLKPSLRLVDNAHIGAIAGTAAPATLTNSSCPFPLNPALNVNLVYVFAGANVVPDDIDKGGVEPVTTARLGLNPLGAWVYQIAFLPPGAYTVAFTCQGTDEDPDRSDNLVFLGTRTVNVADATVTQVDF